MNYTYRHVVNEQHNGSNYKENDQSCYYVPFVVSPDDVAQCLKWRSEPQERSSRTAERKALVYQVSLVVLKAKDGNFNKLFLKVKCNYVLFFSLSNNWKTQLETCI